MLPACMVNRSSLYLLKTPQGPPSGLLGGSALPPTCVATCEWCCSHLRTVVKQHEVATASRQLCITCVCVCSGGTATHVCEREIGTGVCCCGGQVAVAYCINQTAEFGMPEAAGCCFRHANLRSLIKAAAQQGPLEFLLSSA